MRLPELIPARLVERYNRFLADVVLEDTGEALTAHCPNPGSMMGLKAPGSRVWLSMSDNPKRKLKHTLELIEADGGLVAINTNNPNKLAEEAIRTGTIPELAQFDTLKREVKYAERSRVDLLLETGGQKTFVEVKNCHLMRRPGLAEFPDSVTARGAKHLIDLAGEVAAGHRAIMLFIVQRSDCQQFATAPDLDPIYHAGLKAAAEAGVEVLIHDCHISTEKITVRGALPWVSAEQLGACRMNVVEQDLMPMRTGEIRIHGEEGFEGMRKAGRLVAECLDSLVGEVKPGITTADLDDRIREFVFDHGAVSATIGYRGYRHASCISLNHVICHGIPGPRVLKDGDIMNIDVTLILDGWHGDHSRMYAAGTPKRKAERLMDLTYDALMAGLDAIKPGAHLGDIGAAIAAIARKNRLAVVEDFCGHGLGRLFHDEPNVVHTARAGTGPELKPGMFFTVEPMLNLGRKDAAILSDGWTAVTRDRQLSAQFEHSVGVTEEGVEIFTTSPKGYHKPYVVSTDQ